MSRLTARGIGKTYGGKQVLQGIDLGLESGKIYGLLGRNGAGKTTLLSVLTAQNPATAGSVTFDGEPVWENPRALEHLCFARDLGQMSGSVSGLTVREYLRIAAAYCPRWDAGMAARLIREFGLELKKPFARLSRGMVSMVSIVTALASGAEFTILDEPVAGLDVVARERFYTLILDEFARSGRTFVISTHIIEESENLFEEVIILDQGRILLKENTQALLERCFHVSGREDEVARATAGLRVFHEERVGRSLGVTVLLSAGILLLAASFGLLDSALLVRWQGRIQWIVVLGTAAVAMLAGFALCWFVYLPCLDGRLSVSMTGLQILAAAGAGVLYLASGILAWTTVRNAEVRF